jgi:hypothetical protein
MDVIIVNILVVKVVNIVWEGYVIFVEMDGFMILIVKVAIKK